MDPVNQNTLTLPTPAPTPAPAPAPAANPNPAPAPTPNPAPAPAPAGGVTIMSNGQIINGNNPAPAANPAPAPAPLANPVQMQYQQAQQDIKNAQNTLESKGVNYAQLEAEYNATGALSADSYAALFKAGYDKQVVDAVIAGWQAKADNFANAVVNSVGGQAEYEKITRFVQGQGAQAVNAYNAIVSNGYLNVIGAYLQGIRAQMVSVYGTQQPMLTGRSSNNVGLQGFNGPSEMIAAMSDKRYGRDAAYTHEVEQRLAISKGIFN